MESGEINCNIGGILQRMLYLEDFAQQHNEPFYSAWRRFKEYGERCYPTFSSGCFTWLFYNGLNNETRSWVDYGAEATGAPLLMRGYDVINLLNNMADFDYDWHWDPSLQGWSHQYPLYCPNSSQQSEKEEQLLALMQSLPGEINRLTDMVRSVCDNLVAHDSECNNSNNESYESYCYNEEGSLVEYKEDNEPTIEDQDPCEEELIEYEITSKGMDSQVESEQQEEGLLDESVDTVTLEDKEEHDIIDSTSSMILTNKPPMNPYISSTPYYILCELRKASPQAHHPKSCVVGTDFDSNSSLAKLEGKYNNNFQVVLHDAYYGRQPLIDVAPR
ncbi:hypothetical protein CsatB_014493 [Cannabis sativa]